MAKGSKCAHISKNSNVNERQLGSFLRWGGKFFNLGEGSGLDVTNLIVVFLSGS